MLLTYLHKTTFKAVITTIMYARIQTLYFFLILLYYFCRPASLVPTKTVNTSG